MCRPSARRCRIAVRARKRRPCCVAACDIAAGSLRRALATAGFIDVRRWLPRVVRPAGDDALAYVLLALACAIAGVQRRRATRESTSRRSAAGVRSLFYVAAAFRSRTSTNRSARASRTCCWRQLLSARRLRRITQPKRHSPTRSPASRSTSPVATCEPKTRAFVERYAITCCRADAAPVALELERPLYLRDAAWVNVDGTLTIVNGRMVLHVNDYRVDRRRRTRSSTADAARESQPVSRSDLR